MSKHYIIHCKHNYVLTVKACIVVSCIVVSCTNDRITCDGQNFLNCMDACTEASYIHMHITSISDNSHKQDHLATFAYYITTLKNVAK